MGVGVRHITLIDKDVVHMLFIFLLNYWKVLKILNYVCILSQAKLVMVHS